MHLLKRLETYLYTVVAATLLTYTAHNPPLHDLSIWLLGVLGHAIGAAGSSSGGSAALVPPLGVVNGSGSPGSA